MDWKLKDEKTCEEYQSLVKDKVAEAEWKYLDVNNIHTYIHTYIHL